MKKIDEPIIVFWKCNAKCRYCKKKNKVKYCTCPDRATGSFCYRCGGI